MHPPDASPLGSYELIIERGTLLEVSLLKLFSQHNIIQHYNANRSSKEQTIRFDIRFALFAANFSIGPN